MTFDMNQSISREDMMKGRQRAVLITIDHDSYGFREDGHIFRGRAIAINLPENFHCGNRQNKIVQVDREISNEMLRYAGADADVVKNREFDYMEGELLRAARNFDAHGPQTTLIPTDHYRALSHRIESLGNELRLLKEFNLQVAEQGMKARNDALRWKALAKKIRTQRDSVPYLAKKLWRKVLRR